MAEFIRIAPEQLKQLRTVDPRMVSYNVEMTEVTGGTFWKPYTDAQVEGTEIFEPITDFVELHKLMKWYEPINLYDETLRRRAKELGAAWVRVSGTWATKTYYDFDGHTGGKVPAGYQNLLTADQWIGVLEFVKAIDAKLLISVANCAGLHSAQEPWHPEQAKKILDFSLAYGVPVNAVEFTNEPNMMQTSGVPEGYTVEQFGRDQDIFFRFIRENYPDVLVVGPCGCGDAQVKDGEAAKGMAAMIPTPVFLEQCRETPDVFSYHYYNGISERGAGAMPEQHWSEDQTLSEAYLDVAAENCRVFGAIRDKYAPGAPMWVTESGDAGCGGNTWGSTFMDVFRTLNELGMFGTMTDGVIFHNTLASSDYGFLQHGNYDPRPNYYAAYLWTQLMGNTVYDSGEPIREGAHVYARSRKDGKEGAAYLIINNSKTGTTSVELPREAQRYTLSAEHLRSRVMLLNGKPLTLSADGSLPEMEPITENAGILKLEPATITFLVV